MKKLLHRVSNWEIQIWIGTTITVAMVGVLILFSLKDRVWQLPPNELGDFLSGFAGSLSFVWLIVTIFLQREELKLQRNEIANLARESESQSQSLLYAARHDFTRVWSTWMEEFIGLYDYKIEQITDYNVMYKIWLCINPII